MFFKIINIFRSRFFQLGFIVLIGSFSVNILNYIFNLAMGRMLEPAKFGEVASLMGFAGIVGAPAVFLISLMAKYTAVFKEKGKISLISTLFKLLSRYGLIIGLAMLFLFLGLTPVFSWFFRIEKLPFLIFALILPFSLILAVNQGTLQGLQRFVPFSLTLIIISFLKLALAIVFILLGLSVPGVIMALVVSYAVSYLYGLFQVKPHLKFERVQSEEIIKSEINWKDIALYAKVVFTASLLSILFSNTDVILAKHYLFSDLAGQYAALSMAGKIIMYGSAAFLTVMFPMVSASRVKGDGKEKKLLKMSFVLSGGIAGLISALFFFLPQLSIKLLFGAKYLSIAPYLAWFGLAMFFGALAQILITYFMAARIKKYLSPFALIAALQCILIVFFHANILQITFSALISNFLLLAAMFLVYYKQVMNVKIHESF